LMLPSGSAALLKQVGQVQGELRYKKSNFNEQFIESSKL